jgi:carbon storage regulator
MLVLSRKRSERIVIGTSILITVLKVDGNQVRLGIEAPSSLAIVRAELLARQDRDSGGLSSAVVAPERS